MRRLGGDVFGPAQFRASRRDLVLVCLPGGGIARSYYELDVAGERGGYSMARYLAGRGLIVATVDPPGGREPQTEPLPPRREDGAYP